MSLRVLTLPGWQGSGPAHWQSRWEILHGFQRVEQHDWWQPRRGDWMARLDEVLLGEDADLAALGGTLPAGAAPSGTGRVRSKEPPVQAERIERAERVEQDQPIEPRGRTETAAPARPCPPSSSPHRPTLLVAHSLGCHLVAAWAAHSRHAGRVAGALLVAPPDTGRDDLPPQLHGWRSAVTARLPFPATVIASTDDPYASLARTGWLAQAWGAALVVTGACGHLNADAGLGDWPAGLACLQALADSVSNRFPERRIDRLTDGFTPSQATLHPAASRRQ